MTSHNLHINYNLTGIEITAQAYNIAKIFRNGAVSKEIARPILEEYFTWLVLTAKTKFKKNLKRPKFSHFVRATPNF